MRSSSVATITSLSVVERRHRSTTCWIKGLPAIRANGLPGNRDDAYRAGIRPSTRCFGAAGEGKGVLFMNKPVCPVGFGIQKVHPEIRSQPGLRSGAGKGEPRPQSILAKEHNEASK